MKRKLTLDTARITKQPRYWNLEFMGEIGVYERPFDTLTEAVVFCEKYDLEVLEIIGLSKPRAPVPNF